MELGTASEKRNGDRNRGFGLQARRPPRASVPQLLRRAPYLECGAYEFPVAARGPIVKDATLDKAPAKSSEPITVKARAGLSYEEAAEICQVEIGTIKSRLSRARSKLVELLALDEAADSPVEHRFRKAG